MPDPLISAGPLAVRRAGVLLHVTSLPSAYGSGDLGPSAYAFVDFLQRAGCTMWQVLPLVPTHRIDRSPYNAMSAMAGNPELVSLDLLAASELVTAEELEAVRRGALTREDARMRACVRVLEHRDDEPGYGSDFDRWCLLHQRWLDDYVTFVALRESLGDRSWVTWEAPLRDRDADAIAQATAPLAERLALLRVEQWLFARQWSELRAYAAARGVLLFGDLPIFVSHDSADVWGSRELFELDEEGRPTTVTGVPPDYFAVDGQMWNNPHYAWDRMSQDGFAWWRARVAGQRELFDLLRIDHFRGFEAAWHIPADAPSAVSGHWEKSPGREVLTALVETCGKGTLVAEDLGVITPEVEELRREFALPGMKILQFAFDGSPDNPYLPHAHDLDSVVYTGTHDNDTTLGWWEQLDAHDRATALEHVPLPGEPMPWALVRTAMSSVGRLAIVPAQDLLGLGSDSRMNVPGTAEGNWSWQAQADAFDDALAARLRELVETYDRLPA